MIAENNNPLEQAETAIALFVEQLPVLPDDILLTRGKLKECIRRGRELLADIDERCMIPFINTHGEIVAGDIRYYIGTPKDKKCRDFPGALDALFAHCNGDFALVADFLASDAIKPGMFEKELGADAFAKFFDVIEKTEVREGKPTRVKKLIEINGKFVK